MTETLVSALDLHRLSIVGSEHSAVKFGIVHVVYSICRIVLCLVLDEAKTSMFACKPDSGFCSPRSTALSNRLRSTCVARTHQLRGLEVC